MCGLQLRKWRWVPILCQKVDSQSVTECTVPTSVTLKQHVTSTTARSMMKKLPLLSYYKHDHCGSWMTMRFPTIKLTWQGKFYLSRNISPMALQSSSLKTEMLSLPRKSQWQGLLPWTYKLLSPTGIMSYFLLTKSIKNEEELQTFLNDQDVTHAFKQLCCSPSNLPVFSYVCKRRHWLRQPKKML